MLRIESESGDDLWHELFSPRNAFWNDRLIEWRLYWDGMDNVNATNATMTECATTACVAGWLSFGSGERGAYLATIFGVNDCLSI